MTPEDKELLFKDLCARLPYGVKVKFAIPTLLVSIRNDRDGIKIITEGDYSEHVYNIEDIKPYLRPLSSMTEEECVEFKWLNDKCEELPSFEYMPVEHYRIFDWLNRHHFDYRNLIERGLAIDCTNLNVY